MTKVAKLVTMIVITSPLTQEECKVIGGMTVEQRNKGMELLKLDFEQSILRDGQIVERIELEIERNSVL